MNILLWLLLFNPNTSAMIDTAPCAHVVNDGTVKVDGISVPWCADDDNEIRLD